MKKVLVPWSGGLDSTYLIDYLLTNGYSVHAYYVNLPGNKQQSIREQNAIKKMKKYFEPYDFTYHGVAVEVIFRQIGNQRLAYQFLWPLLLMAGEYDYIAIGYVMNDDAISWLPELKKLLDGYKPFVRKFPKLITPLIKTNKHEIWNNLNQELKKHVVWCESSESRKTPCGTCTSCKRMDFLPSEDITACAKTND